MNKNQKKNDSVINKQKSSLKILLMNINKIQKNSKNKVQIKKKKIQKLLSSK